MKILVSVNTTLELFCKKPINFIKSSNNGIISVSKNKKTLFYAMTPEFLKNLFDLECNQKNKIEQKFKMHSHWYPDKDFIQKSALWGIILDKKPTKYELNAFIAYWKAEGCFFHHIQWQQKLARSLQKSRFIKVEKQKRDITYIPIPDKKIPDGFRGK